MDECLHYRRRMARAYMRLFRPLTPGGPRRSRFDQMTARWWTRIDVVVFRHSGISLGVRALGVNDVLLLRTRGRLSGQVREVLVAYVVIDGVLYVCAANGGSDRAPAWYRNLEAGEPIEIECHGRRETVLPVVLEGAHRERVFDVVYQTFPHVRLYLAQTTRPFPIVALGTFEVAVRVPQVPLVLAER
ncbi:MAG: nitroreductase/quinone reductase family protein [Acidimicrobiales bacterium]